MTGAPLVTSGDEYLGRGIPLLCRGVSPPSGGFPTSTLRAFIGDLPGMRSHVAFLRALRARRQAVDHYLVVGDVFLLMIGRVALGPRPAFVALAKSDYDRPHSRLEMSLLRRIPTLVLTRDELTSRSLQRSGVRAACAGNPLMDGLAPPVPDPGGVPVVGVLPGSRAEAYDNLVLILDVVELVREPARFVCALPPTLDPERVAVSAAAAGWIADHDLLRKNGRAVSLARDRFPEVAARSSVVIGLAGTANEQAAGLGIPVVTFVGRGPQTTARRLRSQRNLLGDALTVVAGPPERVASEVSALLADPGERARRGRCGADRMGPPGASARIADLLLREFQAQGST